MRKWIAKALTVLMVFTCIPANVVNAETQSAVAESQEVQNAQEGNNDIGQEEEKAESVEKTEIPEEQDGQEEQQKQSEDKEVVEQEQVQSIAPQSENESDEATVFEQRLNYLYVESPYLETPATQNIVVSWGDGTEQITDMSITVRKEDGTTEEWTSQKDVEHLHLFAKKYDNADKSGAYEVTKINFKQEGIKQEYELDEFNEVSAEFGVNKEYEGFSEVKAPLGEDISTQGVESSVVILDEKGNAESKNDIEEALDEVSGGAERLNKTRASEIVVALDPGHGGKDGGASGNGMYEKDLVLKIAKYAKEELETYAGVRVYMTRTTDTYLGLEERAKAAAKAGAKILVSFHLNSSTGGKAYGAEVIYPNNHWKPQIGADGKKLAQLIQKELVALGLNDRGIYEKNTTEDKYPDGSTQDWYAIPRYSKENGMAGIIVEHAFINNSGDANKYLKSEAGLKNLGIADAKGIAKFLNLSKMGNKTAVSEGTYVLESAMDASKSVDVSKSGFANQLPVVMDDKKNIASQRFEIRSAGNGYYNIVAEHSGKVIDVKSGSSAPGTAIQQYSLNNSAAQQWGFIDAGNGYYYLQSKLGTYMEAPSQRAVNKEALCTSTFDKSAAQKWKLVKTTNQPVKNGTYTISSVLNSGMVVDISGASMANKGNVQLYKSNNSSAQHFEVTHVRDGYYKIATEHSGKVLDVSGGSGSNGANLQQYNWNGSDAQLWKFIDAGNGQFYIRSKKNTMITLSSSTAASGKNIYMWTADGGNVQKWKLSEVSNRPVKDGEYVISSYAANFQAATEKNGNIQLESYDNIENQKLKVAYVSGGYYKISLRKSGKVLDVRGGSDKAGANLQTYTWNGSDAQLWKFISAGNGSYYIKSKLGTTIDIRAGKTISGTNIQMYTMNGTAAQKWVLDSRKISVNERPFANGTYTIRAGNNSGLTLDVSGGSLKNSANVQLYTNNNTSAQKVELYYAGNGYYKILVEHSDKSLDVSGGVNRAGANVQQYSWNGSDAQLWKFIDAGNGKYYIKSKKGTVLDLASGKTAVRSNVQMNTMSNASTQRWSIVTSSGTPLQNGEYSFRITSSVNQVLNVADASTGDLANVRLNAYSNLASQQFAIAHVKNGYYKITAKHSGKVLDVDTKNLRNGANVRQNNWSGTDGQLWKFVSAASGQYYIKSKLGMTLDVAGGKISSNTNIQMYTLNGTTAQRWVPRLEKTSKAVSVIEGTYTIQSALNANRVLDIAGGSSANGTNAQIYTGNDSAAQRFKIQKVSGDYYRIISEQSGKVLDVKGASMAAGANVHQYAWNGSAAQLWKFVDAGNGTYYIQSKLGTVLDVLGGSISKGTNVQSYILNGSTAQKWVADDNRAKLYKIMGKTSVTVDQMVKFYESKRGSQYPYANDNKAGAKTIKEFCQIFLEECNAEGVKAEVAFAQSMLETGYLKFGGDVKASQYNFAGLGATGGGVAGNQFNNIRHGVEAQVQHLKAYASNEALKQTCVDERFKYVKRGTAEYVQWLGIKENPNTTETKGYGWATGRNYGYNMVNLYIIPLKAIK